MTTLRHQILSQMTRGDHSPVITVTVTRSGDAPDFEVDEPEISVFCRRFTTNGSGTLLWTKTLADDEITIESATSFSFRLVPEDTESLTSSTGAVVTLELEAEIIEVDGTVSTPWIAKLPVRMDLG